MKPYDLAVVIGRFQPIHLGHMCLFEGAIKQSDNVLAILGSSFQPRTIKNPFTFEERSFMVKAAVDTTFKEASRPCVVHTVGVHDFLYEETKWIRKVQEAISDTLVKIGKDPRTAKVVLIGHDKDESTYYLNSFKSLYDYVEREKYQLLDEHPIDASQIRSLMFENRFTFVKSALPKFIFEYLEDNFIRTEVYTHLQEEYQFIRDYKKQWEVAPYPVTFNTVDSVVLVNKTHVLLIKRKAAPGKGLWALPGGFLNANETCETAALRELREETRLKVPQEILRSNITHSQRFDHPGRSLRGRTLTDAYLMELPMPRDGILPKVKGSDDAAEAKWFPLEQVLNMGEELFEDHHSIISMLSARAK